MNNSLSPVKAPNTDHTQPYNILMSSGIIAPQSSLAMESSASNLALIVDGCNANDSDTTTEQGISTRRFDSWSKMNKPARLRALMAFSETYRDEHELTLSEYNTLVEFIKECLNKKKLNRIKDVNYNTETGRIKAINGLVFTRTTNKFTLRNLDKHHCSTVKSLGLNRGSSLKSAARKGSSKSRERHDCTV